MKPTEKQIRDRIAEIDSDERYHYKPALVQINAPLALIQVQMEAEARALSWVLGETAPKSGPRQKGKIK
jgi:hypothetical protein